MPFAAYDNYVGSLNLRQCTAASYTANGEPIEGAVSGNLDVSEYFGGPLDLRSTFESEDIAGVAGVSNIGTAGLAVSGGTITVGFQKRADMGTFAGAGNHFTLSATYGLLIPTRFTLPNVGTASASLDLIYVSSNGTSAPVTVNAGATLGSQAFSALHTLGPVAVNGTAFTQVMSATVTPGLLVTTKFYEGYNYLTPAGIKIERRRPMIEFQTDNLALLNALGAGWGLGSSIVVYARKRSGAGFVADATAQHVSFSGADGIVKVYENISAGGSGDATRTVRYWPEALVINGATAIT
jgi:hypothetical protein